MWTSSRQDWEIDNFAVGSVITVDDSKFGESSKKNAPLVLTWKIIIFNKSDNYLASKQLNLC